MCRSDITGLRETDFPRGPGCFSVLAQQGALVAQYIDIFLDPYIQVALVTGSNMGLRWQTLPTLTNCIYSARQEGKSRHNLGVIVAAHTFRKMKYAKWLILNLHLIVSRHGSGPGHCCLKNKLGNSIKVLSKDTS